MLRPIRSSSHQLFQRKKLKVAVVWGSEGCIYGCDGHLGGVFLADINATVASQGKQLESLLFSVFIFKIGNYIFLNLD